MSSGWSHGAVIYHVYPLSFCDSDGDGLGDLPGLFSRLDYIADLGVDAIWVSSFYPSPMKDSGYDVSDHCAVHPAMGTLADFDAIVRRAHALGLKVMIDQVWGHTSDQHAWFRDSSLSRAAYKADWYVWADPRPDGTPPSNWLSVFGGSAWKWHVGRRQYYLHHFLPSQPALNLRNEAVVEELLACGRFWLDRGVDGFRLDAVDFMFHDPGLRDNPAAPTTDSAAPTRPFRMQRHLHDMMGQGTLDFFGRIRALVDEYDGVVTLGEVSSEDGALDRCGTYANPDGSGLHLAYTLGFMKRAFAPELFADAIAAAGRTGGTGLCWAFSNHDVERAFSRWGSGDGDERFARLLMALQLSLPGTLCLYQGEELGLDQAEVPTSRRRDPFGAAFDPVFAGRDGSRTPIPWAASARHAGFTTARRSWLPVAKSHRRLAVDRQDGDRGSLLNAWRSFLRWRHRHPALTHGGAAHVRTSGQVLAFERIAGDSRIACAFNFGPTPAPLPFGDLSSLTPLDGHGCSGPASGSSMLDGYGVFFARRHVASAAAIDRDELLPAAD